MIRRANERNIIIRNDPEKMNGEAIITEIASKEEMFGNARLFAKITIAPDCGFKQHEHHEECEIFCIIKGNAVYNDNGVEIPVSVGDVMIVEDGGNHCINNRSSEEVELISLIPTKRQMTESTHE